MRKPTLSGAEKNVPQVRIEREQIAVSTLVADINRAARYRILTTDEGQ